MTIIYVVMDSDGDEDTPVKAYVDEVDAQDAADRHNKGLARYMSRRWVEPVELEGR